MSGIEPNVGKVLVKLDAAESGEAKTAGGLYIPANAQRDETSKKGTVVAAGPARLVEGSLTSLQFKEGDRVLLDILGGIKLKIEGNDCVLLRAEDILGRLN